MEMIYGLLVVLFSFSAFAGQEIALIVRGSEAYPTVPANVTIENGALLSSNCDTIAATQGIDYELKFSSPQGLYMCVPETAVKSVSTTINYNVGFETNVENFRAAIEAFNKLVEEAEGDQPNAAPQPQCSLGTDGEMDLTSCRCNDSSGYYLFDAASKKCVDNPEVVKFSYPDCGPTSVQIEELLANAGIDFTYRMEVGMGFCGGYSTAIGFLLPHELIYRLAYFALFKNQIAESLGLDVDHTNFLLSISQTDLQSFKTWAETFKAETNIEELDFLNADQKNRLTAILDFAPIYVENSLEFDLATIEEAPQQ